MPANAALLDAVRRGLQEIADPVKAQPMQAYMKSTMPFLGVPAPERRKVVLAIFRARPLRDESSWRATVLELWRTAQYREQRYAAVELTGHYPSYLRLANLDVIEELVVDGAWWDYVDDLAIRRLGPILRADPTAMTAIVTQWAGDGDRWKRRSAVICQIGSKEKTDADLLERCIDTNVGDPDFFVRKAIGWALREHSKTDPEWVRAFVHAHPGLSPLSRREALRRIRR